MFNQTLSLNTIPINFLNVSLAQIKQKLLEDGFIKFGCLFRTKISGKCLANSTPIITRYEQMIWFSKSMQKIGIGNLIQAEKTLPRADVPKSWKINKIWIFWSQKSQIKGKCKFKLQFKIQIKQLAYIHNWENNTSRHLQATLPTNIIKLFKNNTVKKGQAKNIDLVLSWHIK